MISLDDYVRDKSVIIVGPGSTVKDDCKGIDVNSFDIVCRLNLHWRLNEGDHVILGNRTDLLYHCLNSDQYSKDDIAFWKKNNIRVVARNDIYKNKIHSKRDQFERRNKGIKLKIDVIPDSFFKKYEKELECNPSTGIITILHLLSLPVKDVTVVGFDFYNTLYWNRNDPKWLAAIHKMDHNPKKQSINFKKVIYNNEDYFKKFIPVGAIKNVMDTINLV